jgi:hypothetical protein
MRVYTKKRKEDHVNIDQLTGLCLVVLLGFSLYALVYFWLQGRFDLPPMDGEEEEE